MISENLSHDSKVWTKEYDLDGKLMRETGRKQMKMVNIFMIIYQIISMSMLNMICISGNEKLLVLPHRK